jgi:hypothetical protein
VGVIGSTRGLQTHIRPVSYTNEQASVLENPEEGEDFVSAPDRGTNFNRQGSRIPNSGPVRSRVLLKHFHSSKEGLGQVKTCYKPKPVEPFISQGEVYDGNTPTNHCSTTAGGLDDLGRSHGCLPARPHAPEFMEVSQIRSGQQSIRIQMSPVRPISRSICLHESNVSDFPLRTQKDATSVPISRRFSTSQRTERPSSPSDTNTTRSNRQSRFPTKQREVITNSGPSVYVPRSPIRPSFSDCANPGRQMDQAVVHDHFITRQSQQPSEYVVQSFGSIDVSPAIRRTRTTACQTITIPPSRTLGPETQSLCPYSYVGGLPSPTVVVDEQAPHHGRCIHSRFHPYHTIIHRCIHPGVGCTCGSSALLRGVESQRQAAPHQQSGIESGDSSFPVCYTQVIQSEHSPVDGQLDRGLLHKQAGRDALLSALPANRGTTPPGSQPRIADKGEAYPGRTQRARGPALALRTDYIIGMDTVTDSSESPIPSLGPADDGLVCNKVHNKVPSVCVPVSRCQSLGSRRSGHVLGSSERVCIPSDDPYPQSPGENPDIISQDPVDRPSVAIPDLVPQPARASRGCSVASPPVGRPSKTAQDGDVSDPVSTPDTAASRVATIRRHLRKEGFSGEVAARIVKRNRPSTQAMYSCRWKQYDLWCRNRGVDPIKASIPIIADFLLELFKKKYTPGTVKGFRSAISSTLRHFGRDIGSNQDIVSLLSSMTLERPRTERTMPTWNLAFVLESLTSDPYEPIGRCDLTNLNRKTAFLLLLASGTRVSELHACEASSIHFQTNYEYAVLSPNLSFLPKNLTPEEAHGKIRTYTIKALTSFVDERMSEERYLCPIRALKTYIARTQTLRKCKGRLFISALAPHGEVKKQTLSHWVKTVILNAYVNSSNQNKQLAGVRAHDVRAMSASWVFQNSVPLTDVLRAGTWKNHSTFTDFYLRDLATINDNMLSFGTLSVSQQVV